MSIAMRLKVMSFLQYFIWGSWLVTLGSYMINTLHFTGANVGMVYSSKGIAAIIMPGIMGIIADKWLRAERAYMLCHLVCAGVLFYAASVTDPDMMFWVMLVNAMAFMPTIALSNSVSYSCLAQAGLDPVTAFPPIRVFGTVGFIVAMWAVSLLHLELSSLQLYIASGASLLLSAYALTLPKIPVAEKKATITNVFGNPFLHDFARNPEFADSFVVKYPSILLSVSQMAEVGFILTIPFFLKRFGIKTVMLMSMVAWTLRFGFFAYGDPSTTGFILLLLSMIVYGCAFDFFNISGSVFVEQEVDSSIRASAQGLFMTMVNGVGAWVGSILSGMAVDYFSVDGVKDWQTIWLVFAGYALFLAVIFFFGFKYNYDPEKIKHRAVAH
ncbi:MAG: MFS transporter [Escherichia coli]|nr:MFS transporter [Escherichia coli]